MADITGDPTLESYNSIKIAYDFFNQKLFDKKLPKVVISFHRQRKVMGYAFFQRWKSRRGEIADELAVNPEYFDQYPLIEICQTLCHEMVHLWQAHFGKPGRRGYHNAEWANKMESIGLMPSSTGKPGGDTTGEIMMDYVIYDERFFLAFQELVGNGFTLSWVDRFPVFRHDTPVLAFNRDGAAVELDDKFHLKKELSSGAHDVSGAALNYLDNDESEINLAFLNQSGSKNETPAFLSSKAPQKSGRVKYACRSCHILVWGKPGLNIGCMDCNLTLMEVF